jgi:hypothetical protein
MMLLLPRAVRGEPNPPTSQAANVGSGVLAPGGVCAKWPVGCLRNCWIGTNVANYAEACAILD